MTPSTQPTDVSPTKPQTTPDTPQLSKGSEQYATPGRYCSKTIENSAQEARQTMQEIREAAAKMGITPTPCSPAKPSGSSKGKRQSGIPSPTKTLSSAKPRKVKEASVAVSRPMPASQIERVNIDSKRTLRDFMKEGKYGGEEKTRRENLQPSTPVLSRTQRNARGSAVNTPDIKVTGPSPVASPTGKRTVAQQVTLPLRTTRMEPPDEANNGAREIAEARKQTSPEPAGQQTDRNTLLKDLGGQRRESKLGIQNALPAVSEEVNGESRARSTSPKKSAGTPPATRKAMKEDMQSMRMSLGKSVGPSYFRRSQLGGSGGPISTPRSGRGSPEAGRNASSTGNMSDGLRRRVLEKKQSEGDLSTSVKGSTATLRRRIETPIKTPTRASTLRASPLKSKGESASIPRASRKSIFDATLFAGPASTPRKTIAPSPRTSRSHLTPTVPNIDFKSSKAVSSAAKIEEQKIASAQDISNFIQDLHAQDKDLSSQRQSAPQTSAFPPSKPLMRISHDRKLRPRTSTTPPGSPPLHMKGMSPQGRTKHPIALTPSTSPSTPGSTMKNPKSRFKKNGLSTPASTVRGRRAALKRDEGASRTPSKEIVKELDRAIDERIAEDAKAGRVFTPSGMKISDLLERRKGSKGVKKQ